VAYAPGTNDVEIGGGVNSPDAGTAGDDCPTTDMPPSDPAALRVYNLIEGTEHARLQQAIGQYVCGTSPIYRGTFAAQDNAGSFGLVDGVITAGPVIASVQTSFERDFLGCGDETVMGVRALVVLATAQSRAIRLFQILGGDGSTYSSLVSQPQTLWSGSSPMCDGCVADLRGDAPASLSLGPVTMTASCAGTTPLEVTLSGQLTMLPNPSLADILEMNQPFGTYGTPPAFVQQGDDMVAPADGVLYEVTYIVNETGMATPFHLEWYVSSQTPTLFGLRNFRVDPPQPLCGRSPD
jgi:hypothetical protein